MLNQSQNSVSSGIGSGVSQPKSLLHKDLELAKHPKSKVAFPKTEVLGKPHVVWHISVGQV
jgi:hypothetical protein